MYNKRVTTEHIKKLFEKYGAEQQELIPPILRKVFENPKNIDTFAQFFFPETVTSKIPKFHMEMYQELFKDKNSAISAPRGHGKSSVTGIIFLIFCIVNKLEKYIVYVSQNHTKTVQFLDPIRSELKKNVLLKFVYGDFTVKAQKDEDARDREDCFDINGIRIEAVSFEKNLRGFKYGNIRPTLIIGDDIEDDQRVLNPELRIKDQDKLNKIIIPSLDVNGRFKMIGTILHHDSLLVNKLKSYNGKTYSAISEDGEVLWKERFSKSKLEQIRKDIGSVAFQQEYLNNPIDNTSSLIKREWIEQCFDHTLSYSDATSQKYKLMFEGTDFAFSDRVSADNSAFVSIGVADNKQITVFDCQLKKGLSINEQLTFLKESLYARFKYDQIGLEENSIKAISKDVGQWNMPITLFWTSASDPAEKKNKGADYDYLGKRHTVGKLALIMRLGTAFENQRFVLPYKTEEDRKITDRILSECNSFALSDGKLVEANIHPDIPIALGYALELVNNYESVIIDI